MRRSSAVTEVSARFSLFYYKRSTGTAQKKKVERRQKGPIIPVTRRSFEDCAEIQRL